MDHFLGMTAEKVAKQYGITREEQDAFALESQRRAGAAIRDGSSGRKLCRSRFAKTRRSGRRLRGRTSRPDIAAANLTALRPACAADGRVTAGNASGINVGASALLLVAEGAVNGATPLARVVASAVAGIDPSVMGLGPVPATRKVLQRAGLRADQIDLVELNEAFASQAIACMRDLDLDPARVNVYGGAALGHALGSSGSRMLASLVHALHRRNARYGLATMCIGVGQGIAVIIERM
jgi:acetyl-CoA acetyltransferase family protein